MRPISRALAIAVSLATLGIGAAYAGTATGGANSNPAQRGTHDSFFFGPLSGKTSDVLDNSLNTNQIARPRTNHSAVTPVPEPSQWAMMLAGLALVGFIVKRRNGSR
jgi:hypothetical protein